MMNVHYPHLFQSIKIGSVRIKNRIELAPMSFTVVGPTGGYSKDNIAFYETVARGGAGLITIGEAIVSMQTGKSHPHMVRICDPEVFPTLADLAEAIHRHNAHISIEISHAGGADLCLPSYNFGNNPMGPTRFTRLDGVLVEEMNEKMMNVVADDFAASAETLQRAGFDMIMFHAGHGWLVSQFLSPFNNKRTDNYGGSLENRARFPIMILDRIRDRVGKNFPIEMRISGTEARENGFELKDAIAFCQMVEDKIDLIQVSAGGIFSLDGTHIMSPGMFLPRGCNVYLAEGVKKAVRIPVTCVGGLAEPEMMDDIIASGRADMVTIGRALIADPDLPNKAKYGQTDDILRCLRCTECHGRLFEKGSMKCQINPIIGREYEHQFMIPPAKHHRKVLIAGGGPGGMQAAITASERGHEVILCEKKDHLGGALTFADQEPFKQDLAYFYKQLVNRVSKSGATVRLGTEVTPELVKEIGPDVLIAAIGAEPVVLNIPGINSPNVILGTQVYEKSDELGEEIIIIGGGLVGCEIAVHLSIEGKKVTIIEMLNEIAPDTNPPHKNALIHALQNVKIQTELKCIGVDETGVTVQDRQNEEIHIPGDTVILSVGMTSLSDGVDRLEGLTTDYVVIGDCGKPGKVGDAIHGGYNAALDL